MECFQGAMGWKEGAIPPSGLSVLCDFDGTVTLIDTAEYILDHYAEGDWRGVERRFERGDISIEECMSLQFEMISISRDRMLRELDEVVLVRPGFDRLIEGCLNRGARFRITSAGLDFYIRHFLTRNGWNAVEVVAPRVTEAERGITFQFPQKRHQEARNFKEDHVLRERGEGRRIAYIGDGTSDLWAALTADRAFAVRGSKLDILLGREGRGHTVFTDLGEVADELFP